VFGDGAYALDIRLVIGADPTLLSFSAESVHSGGVRFSPWEDIKAKEWQDLG
jgi:hypothetical protein